MREQILRGAGLTPDQSLVYEKLLTEGPSTAGRLSVSVGLKRGLTYKVLGELIALKLAEKKEVPGEVAKFEAGHPLRIKDLVDSKAREAENAGRMLHGVLPGLISEFNLVSGQPGIQFFEGEEGIKHVLEDSLTSSTEICSYADIEAILTRIPKINEAYVRKREKLGVAKKGIVLDTPFARARLFDYYKNITTTKFIKLDAPPFGSVMQIYDNKISYLTLDEKRKIGVIIEDANLYTMHKDIFEYLWRMLPTIK